MADAATGPDRRSLTAANLLYYGTAQIASVLLALVLVGVLGRALGAVGFGRYSFTFVVASFGALVADFGVGPWMTRAIAQYAGQARILLAEAFRLRIVTGTAGAVLVLVYAWLRIPDPSGRAGAAWMLVYVLLLGYVGVYEAALMGRQRADRVALSMGLGKVFELAAVLVWVGLGTARTVAGAAAALAAACAVRLVLVRSMTRSVLKTTHESQAGAADVRDPSVARVARQRMIREALPFAAGSLVWTTYFKVDVLILERLGTPAGLGLYTAAYRVLEALVLFPRTVSSVVYPVVAAAWKERTFTGALLSRPARALGALALACAAGIWVLSPGIMTTLFGAPFAGGAGALRLLGLAMVPLFLNYLLGMVLSSTHRQGEWVMYTLLAFVINVTANLILIPRLGFEGAAWATLASEIVMLAMLGIAVLRRHGRMLSPGWLARAALAAAAMGMAVARIPGPFWARVTIGAATFALFAWILRVVEPADGQVVLETMRRLGARGTRDTHSRPAI